MTLTPNSLASPARVASISFALPNPLSITSIPAWANDLAMPRPMPLVDPVTTAVFPTSSPVDGWGLGLVLLSSIDASCSQVIGAAHAADGNQMQATKNGRTDEPSGAAIAWD